ncbi:MAG TPA: FHA domain-containing protein [Deltaproteobacteria bacterium]|nr:FHA domain-containing protein [Deltaproteobacteria bacterium]
MTALFEILLPSGEHTISIGDVPLSVGRGPANDLVLQDDTISWRHAQLWVEAGAAWLRDLRSRNGTWRNEQRVHGALRLAPGDRIRFGATVEVILQGGRRGLGTTWETYHIEDLSSGVRLLVRSDRFRIGSGADCDLRVAGMSERAATVLLHDNGEIWVGIEGAERQIQIGEVFEVSGHQVRVLVESADHAPTVDWATQRYPYTLLATANAAGGPQVVVSDPASGAQCLVTGNRGVLLFVLARRLLRDREAEAERAEEGWCTTEEAVTGVWGRGRKGSNQLSVLVHRLRGHLEENGFDPWFIEKRRGGIRVRCAQVSLR